MAQNYEDIEEFLVGKCGYTIRSAMNVTLREYNYKIRQHAKNEIHNWEVARWVVYHNFLLHPYLKAHDKPKRPQDILPLPTDKEEINKVVTPKDIEITEGEVERLKEIFAKNKE